MPTFLVEMLYGVYEMRENIFKIAVKTIFSQKKVLGLVTNRCTTFKGTLPWGRGEMMTKDECKTISGVKICNPHLKAVTFNFLTGGGSNAQAKNAVEYLKQMQKRATDVEGTVEGKGIYEVFLDIAKGTNLGKRKGQRKLVQAIKMGTDVCGTLKCDTTNEMSLMLGDVMNIFKGTKFKVEDGVRPAHELVLDRKMDKFIGRVGKKAGVLR